MFRVSEAAALSGLTIRALHHYDSIGLLRPSARTDAEYRLYGNDDISALRRIRRYQTFGFSLGEIRELLTATRADRITAFRTQRNAIRQRVSETADVARALNREITLEETGGTQLTDRLGRAASLLEQYFEEKATEPVPQQSFLLSEALQQLQPLTTGLKLDPAAVKLAVTIQSLRYDWANVAALCQRFLDQEPSWDDRAFATLELVTALILMDRSDEARTIHETHIKNAVAERPTDEWADAMWNSTHARCWIDTGNREAWINLYRTIDTGIAGTSENRESRFELLHTAVTVMGTDYDAFSNEIEILTARMAEIIEEDLDWHARLWAELRFEQQKVGNAVRQGDSKLLTDVVLSYKNFLDGCDWPSETIGIAYSNLGAIMHWEGRESTALECFTRAQHEHELDGYGYAWFAAASLANGESTERVTELLAEAGSRLESADAMRIFNEDSVLSTDTQKEQLLEALLPTVR